MPANRCAVPQRRRADRKDRVQSLACRTSHAIAFGNCKGILIMGEFLSVERRGKIAILTMIKPESMNAIGTHEDCQDIIERSEGRRVGKECVRKCRSRWAPDH